MTSDEEIDMLRRMYEMERSRRLELASKLESMRSDFKELKNKHDEAESFIESFRTQAENMRGGQ